MAGHSKWANIKHKKSRNDAKRGKTWSKCARAIIMAAKNGGDPGMNLTLRYAIDEAKSHNMPKDTITNAIKKGTGELASASYESFAYEGYGVNGVAVIIEILTDNRNRTAPEIKRIFEKCGGNMGTTGCVSYLFQACGQVIITKGSMDENVLMEAALEAGAQDVIDQDESWQVVCQPADLIPIREAIEAAGITVESASMTMTPSTWVTCTGKDARKVLNLIEALDDHDDVQKVHANFDIPEEELAGLED